MVKVKCMFKPLCDEEGESSFGCPFKRPITEHTAKLLPIDCTVWQVYQETEKERRFRYAQEKRIRNENAGSGRKA
jgi:hypothetical protein